MKAKKSFSGLFLLLLVILTMSSCAEVQPDAWGWVVGTTYGFWGGLWHGFTLLFSIFGRIFDDKIAIYAINNTGVWYDGGFVLGVVVFRIAIYYLARFSRI